MIRLIIMGFSLGFGAYFYVDERKRLKQDQEELDHIMKELRHEREDHAFHDTQSL